jgi:hypothetical protein
MTLIGRCGEGEVVGGGRLLIFGSPHRPRRNTTEKTMIFLSALLRLSAFSALTQLLLKKHEKHEKNTRVAG